MQLYHFRDAKYGLKSLTDKRLKIARINELNDPLKMLGCNLSDSNKRQAFQIMKEKLNKDKGLLCFSASWRNPVQWAHYLNNHTGICMTFEVPDEFLRVYPFCIIHCICNHVKGTGAEDWPIFSIPII